jgi:hypothetical protein
MLYRLCDQTDHEFEKCLENGFCGIQRLTIAREFNDKSAERRAYTNLGNAYIFLGEFEVASDLYQ